MNRRLLINWVYYHYRAFRMAQAFRNCDPDLEIAVAINARSGPQLASCVGAIDAIDADGVKAIAMPCPTKWHPVCSTRFMDSSTSPS